MPTVRVPVKKRVAEIPLPAYNRQGDAGLDIRAGESLTLQPGERRAVKTGLHVALPEGTVGIIKDRSGLAFRFGLHTLAGVIDSNYRGEVKIVLLNLGRKRCCIKTGDRIAQLIILPYLRAEIISVSSLSETSRNEAGFGSSGME